MPEICIILYSNFTTIKNLKKKKHPAPPTYSPRWLPVPSSSLSVKIALNLNLLILAQL